MTATAWTCAAAGSARTVVPAQGEEAAVEGRWHGGRQAGQAGQTAGAPQTSAAAQAEVWMVAMEAVQADREAAQGVATGQGAEPVRDRAPAAALADAAGGVRAHVWRSVAGLRRRRA